MWERKKAKSQPGCHAPIHLLIGLPLISLIPLLPASSLSAFVHLSVRPQIKGEKLEGPELRGDCSVSAWSLGVQSLWAYKAQFRRKCFILSSEFFPLLKQLDLIPVNSSFGHFFCEILFCFLPLRKEVGVGVGAPGREYVVLLLCSNGLFAC